MYHLDGVVHHLGGSLAQGHYLAYIRLSNNTWRRYNDAAVSKVPQKEALGKNALLLSYTRR